MANDKSKNGGATVRRWQYPRRWSYPRTQIYRPASGSTAVGAGSINTLSGATHVEKGLVAANLSRASQQPTTEGISLPRTSDGNLDFSTIGRPRFKLGRRPRLAPLSSGGVCNKPDGTIDEQRLGMIIGVRQQLIMKKRTEMIKLTKKRPPRLWDRSAPPRAPIPHRFSKESGTSLPPLKAVSEKTTPTGTSSISGSPAKTSIASSKKKSGNSDLEKGSGYASASPTRSEKYRRWEAVPEPTEEEKFAQWLRHERSDPVNTAAEEKEWHDQKELMYAREKHMAWLNEQRLTLRNKILGEKSGKAVNALAKVIEKCELHIQEARELAKKREEREIIKESLEVETSPTFKSRFRDQLSDLNRQIEKEESKERKRLKRHISEAIDWTMSTQNAADLTPAERATLRKHPAVRLAAPAAPPPGELRQSSAERELLEQWRADDSPYDDMLFDIDMVSNEEERSELHRQICDLRLPLLLERKQKLEELWRVQAEAERAERETAWQGAYTENASAPSRSNMILVRAVGHRDQGQGARVGADQATNEEDKGRELAKRPVFQQRIRAEQGQRDILIQREETQGLLDLSGIRQMPELKPGARTRIFSDLELELGEEDRPVSQSIASRVPSTAMTPPFIGKGSMSPILDKRSGVGFQTDTEAAEYLESIARQRTLQELGMKGAGEPKFGEGCPTSPRDGGRDRPIVLSSGSEISVEKLQSPSKSTPFVAKEPLSPIREHRTGGKFETDPGVAKILEKFAKRRVEEEKGERVESEKEEESPRKSASKVAAIKARIEAAKLRMKLAAEVKATQEEAEERRKEMERNRRPYSWEPEKSGDAEADLERKRTRAAKLRRLEEIREENRRENEAKEKERLEREGEGGEEGGNRRVGEGQVVERMGKAVRVVKGEGEGGNDEKMRLPKGRENSERAERDSDDRRARENDRDRREEGERREAADESRKEREEKGKKDREEKDRREKKNKEEKDKEEKKNKEDEEKKKKEEEKEKRKKEEEERNMKREKERKVMEEAIENLEKEIERTLEAREEKIIEDWEKEKRHRKDDHLERLAAWRITKARREKNKNETEEEKKEREKIESEEKRESTEARRKRHAKYWAEHNSIINEIEALGKSVLELKGKMEEKEMEEWKMEKEFGEEDHQRRVAAWREEVKRRERANPELKKEREDRERRKEIFYKKIRERDELIRREREEKERKVNEEEERKVREEQEYRERKKKEKQEEKEEKEENGSKGKDGQKEKEEKEKEKKEEKDNKEDEKNREKEHTEKADIIVKSVRERLQRRRQEEKERVEREGGVYVSPEDSKKGAGNKEGKTQGEEEAKRREISRERREKIERKVQERFEKNKAEKERTEEKEKEKERENAERGKEIEENQKQQKVQEQKPAAQQSEKPKHAMKHPSTTGLPHLSQIHLHLLIFNSSDQGGSNPRARHHYASYEQIPLDWTISRLKAYLTQDIYESNSRLFPGITRLKLRFQCRWLRHGRRMLRDEGLRDWDTVVVVLVPGEEGENEGKDMGAKGLLAGEEWKNCIREADGMAGWKEGWPGRGAIRMPGVEGREMWVREEMDGVYGVGVPL